ncbi:hypothetical protein ACWEF9_11740 [Streptomyces sp. NPDC004980]
MPVNHPAATTATTGRRDLAHLESQSSAADVRLVLDRIDEIVTPGTAINPADSSTLHPAVQPAADRRRPTAHHCETTN